jgi:hypothetical protein
MKHRSICILATFASAVVAVSAYELTSSEPSNPSPPTKRDAPQADAAREREMNERMNLRMKAQARLITGRLGISAPLDATETTDPATGIDVIEELHASGFIIPVTLEEVEAALQAAALTPETADDRAALILKHRGSYRFFLND